MHSSKYRDYIKALVIKAFARVGKNTQDNLERMQILIDDILEREIPEHILLKAFYSHAENSQYVPSIADIMKLIQTTTPEEEVLFLKRFREQATRSYEWDAIDDDVYTAKELIGKRQVENAYISEWNKIEKQAIEIFKLIKSGKLSIQKNKNTPLITTLPNGGRYLQNTLKNEN